MTLLEHEVELCNPEGGLCSQNVSIAVIEDLILERDESFTIGMTSNIQQVSIQTDSATVTILDDDSEFYVNRNLPSLLAC